MQRLSSNTTLSHYRIVSKLGAGGMGEVYLAQDTSELGRKVALKVLPDTVAADKHRLQRFTQEARTVSNLNHPNILTVYEFGQTQSVCFMATEFVDGLTLRQYVSKRRLKLIDLLDVAIQIVAALNAAHEAGVTHRDLKPDNVMIRRDRIVKVLDFGLAKLSEREAMPIGSVASEDATQLQVNTTPGAVMGTVSYMSPEQSAGKEVDQRTDIWSFGVLLYEMLAGVLPFQGKDVHREIIAIQESEPAPLSQTVEGVPERLEEIVAKCLAKEREERYQTAKDLLIDLRNFRRKLDLDAEIERTVAPAQRSTSAAAKQASTKHEARTVIFKSAETSDRPQSNTAADHTKTKLKWILASSLVLLVLAGAFVAGRYFTANKQIESIAVMPFVNTSGAPDVEYLSDGMTETLISVLSQIPKLSVKSRSTVFYYKGKETSPKRIGEELNVQAVLLGRLVQQGEDLKLSVELVNTATQNVIWSEQYSRKRTELLTLQTQLAHDISQKLQTKLTQTEEPDLEKKYTSSAEAYELYLKGRYHWNRRTVEDDIKSLDYFQKAVKVDPKFALAYVGVSDAQIMLGIPDAMAGTVSPSSILSAAKAAAEKAIEIDPTMAEAYASRGHVRWKSFDWSGAESDFKHSIELNPNYSYAHLFYSVFLTYNGRIEEGLTEARRAAELDPYSIPIVANACYIYALARRYDEAIALGKRAVEFDDSIPIGHQRLGVAYEGKGILPEAITEYKTAVDKSNRVQLAVASLAHAYARAGNQIEARKLLTELEERASRDFISPYLRATVYASLGEKERAIELLEEAYAEHSIDIVQAKIDPNLDALRSEQRFQTLVKKMEFPQ
jgi:serine/threonine protein kinase/Tfp pilus assembly protein PilF